jgi:hypothetical protein
VGIGVFIEDLNEIRPSVDILTFFPLRFPASKAVFHETHHTILQNAHNQLFNMAVS